MVRRRPYTEEELEVKRLKQAAYNARPDVKARKRVYANSPEAVEKRRAYHQRPEVKQRYVDRRDDEAHKEYCKGWRQSQRGKQKMKEYGLKQRAFTLCLWETLRSLQGNACAVCRKPFSDDPRDIHADHCHEQNLPRGLLCQACNHAEGQIRKTGLTPEEFCRRLTNYLGRPPAQQVQDNDSLYERIY